MAAQKLPPHHAQGLKALEGFFKASASLARGTRGRLMELEKEIPETVVRSLRSGPDDAALHAILVPEQTYVTLAIHSRYADFLDQSASTAGPGLLLQHQHPDFKRIVNRYGIVALSRRHGAGAADTSEALSGGQQRLTQRIRALEVPPLPPDMATLRKLDGTPYVATVRRPSSEVGSLLEPADASSTRDAASTPNDRPWRPRGVLAANLYGHDNAVNRVVASQDNLFFATGSDDGTVRLWMTAGLEDGYGIRPKLTYASQGGCIADLCIVENTHAVAAASTSGSVHVFKVEHALDVTRAAVDPNDMMGGPSSSVVINSGDGTSEDLLLDKAEARHAQARSAADAAMREERNARGSLSAGLAGGGAHGNGNTSIGTTVSGMGSNAGPGAGASGSTVPGVGANSSSSSSSSSQSFSHGTQRGSSQQRSLGASTVLELNLARDGPVRAICHYPAVSESVLVCASESGAVHGWDLRARKRSWVLRVGPQAGVITALAVPPEGDPIWLVAGTSRGVILLYDLRFSILLKAWRHPSHSRIHRLYLSRATCSDPFVYVAAGVNSTSLYNVSDGAMVHSYRTVPTSVKGKDATADAPLEEIDVRALEVNPSIPEPMWSQLAVDELDASTARMEPSVRAIVCPFDMSDVRKHMAHIPTTVITAGTDRRIRYWNQDHNLCYSVFDQEFGRSVNQHWDRLGKVVVCREDIAGHQAIGQAQPAQRQQSQFSAEGRGLPHPSTNHEDAILDLAFLAAPSRLGGTLTQRASTGLLLSASRDGIVKAWA
ncbi:Phosphoinositide 3-kinase regulatory subunit 4 [Hondaea fermentalgiana]|uniref:Phosphoinositide 3-kinase regulatory subunit 4 n=1 Tax=Hondaea fermentalgiana TaxID=2315210 RepID=A0A2R5GUI9_9STRA|nr:Phosphoinositide 3-kinase regulatory subunit 4 [Hondaea fermentalgiana]|eukprot:GBG32041.1 Phosphoinositide 3-kinase regulatory subunit 4 [Hondaea fermentalgiana]